MTRWFILTRARARSRFLATAAMRQQVEASGYRVILVRCHEVPWLPGRWDGVVEIEEPVNETHRNLQNA